MQRLLMPLIPNPSLILGVDDAVKLVETLRLEGTLSGDGDAAAEDEKTRSIRQLAHARFEEGDVHEMFTELQANFRKVERNGGFARMTSSQSAASLAAMARGGVGSGASTWRSSPMAGQSGERSSSASSSAARGRWPATGASCTSTTSASQAFFETETGDAGVRLASPFGEQQPISLSASRRSRGSPGTGRASAGAAGHSLSASRSSSGAVVDIVEQ